MRGTCEVAPTLLTFSHATFAHYICMYIFTTTTTSAVELLSHIWICFPEFVCDEKNVDTSKSILRALRRSSRTESFSLSIVSLTNQFAILESLIQQNVTVEITKGKKETNLEEAPVVVRVTKRFARLAINLLLAERKRNYRG